MMPIRMTALMLALLAAFPLAYAQRAPDPQPVPDPEQARRPDSPGKQELPMTKEVVSGEQLSQSQEGYSDAVKNVAGLSPTNSSGTSNDAFLIRGIKLNLFANYRLDGGLPVTGVITVPTENKSRVETLKGANALMYGVASPAGIINFVPKRAGAVDVTTAGFAGNGFGQYGLSADVGRRFGSEKQLGVRLNASAVHLENGVHDLDGTGSFFSLGSDLRVNSRLTLQADLEHYERHVPEQGGVSLQPAVKGVVAITRVPAPRNLLSGSWDVYSPRTTNLQARADYQLDDAWKVLLQGGVSESHRHRDTVRISGYDPVTGANGQVLVQPITHDYRNSFFRTELLGHFTTWSLRHDLTVGVSRSERWAHAYDVQNVILPQRQNIFDPIVLKPPVFTKPGADNPVQDSTDSGLYTYDTIGVTQKLKLMAGVRLVRDMEENGTVSSTSRVTSPAAGLLYDLRPTTTVYASYMQGLEAGATAPFNAANANVILGPTISRQKEIGITETSLRGVNLNAAYFDITRANATTDPVSNIYGYYGDIHYRGLESTLLWDVNSRWRVNGAVLWLLAIQEAPVQPLFNGQVPENTPRWNANFGVSHRASFLPGLTLRAGLKTIARRPVNNADQGFIPGYTLFDAGANYVTQYQGHRTTLGVAIDNLANKRYWNSVNSGTYGIGMDRAIKFNVKVDI